MKAGDDLVNGWKAVDARHDEEVGVVLAHRSRPSPHPWATWLFRVADPTTVFQGNYHADYDEALADLEARADRHGLTPEE